MTLILKLQLLLIFCVMCILVDCQKSGESMDTVTNSRVTKVVEMHSHNIRQFFCRGNGISAEEWNNIKDKCINPRISEIMPENAINAWQQCNEKVVDLCDDQQWTEGKTCAKEVLKDENVGEMQMWYRTRVRQLTNNFQIIKVFITRITFNLVLKTKLLSIAEKNCLKGFVGHHLNINAFE